MLLFIHIAKTGGMSIRRMLNRYTASYDCLHNNTLIQRRGTEVTRHGAGFDIKPGDYDLVSYLVRNPYDRLLSCYRYFHAGGLNQFGKKHFPQDAELQKKVQREFPDFESCCADLEKFCTILQHARPMVSRLPDFVAEKHVFMGKYESIGKDVLELFSILGIDLSAEDVMHVNRTTEISRSAYNPSMKHNVFEYYRNDFERFGYSDG